MHNKTVANLVTAKMLHCYMLVNTLQMYTLNSTYSPIKRRIPDKVGPCLNFFLEMYRIYRPIFSLCLHITLQAFKLPIFFKASTPVLHESTVLLKSMKT